MLFLHERGNARTHHYMLLGEWCLLPRLSAWVSQPTPRAAVFFWEHAAATGYIPALRRLGTVFFLTVILLISPALSNVIGLLVSSARLFDEGHPTLPADRARATRYWEQAALMGDAEASALLMGRLPISVCVDNQ